MFKATPKPLSGYTSLKRKWQDSTEEMATNEEGSDIEENLDEDAASDISEDSEGHSVEWLLELLKGSSMEPSSAERFRKLVQESLLNSLQALQKELTIIKELVDVACSPLSKSDLRPLQTAAPSRNKTPKLLEFS